jgi:hypothetical protein
MKLTAAARRFDRLKISEAYTGEFLFKAQLLPSVPAIRDSYTDNRRTLSVNPCNTMPDRSVIADGTDIWLVGTKNNDFHNGEPIRSEYIIFRADGLASIKSASETIANLDGLTAYATKVWVKIAHDLNVTSEKFNQYSIYFGRKELVNPRTFIKLENGWFLVKSVSESPSHYLVALCEEVTNLIKLATYSSKTYVAITDSYTTVVSNFNVLLLRWQTYYDYEQEVSNIYKVGDKVALIRKVDMPTVKVSSTISIDSVIYTVESFSDEGDVWGVHLRNG